MAIIWDTADYYFPSLWFTGHLWSNGILPLWNSFIFNGYPIFADPQNQTFYPLNIVISFLTNFSAKVVYLQLVFHYILSGIFMYLYAGFYVKNTAGRLVASLIYMFNGFMVNQFQHLTMINSVVWLPLILFFLEKGWRSRNISFFIPAGISIAFLIFAGHPQTMLYILYIPIFFSVFKCFNNGAEKHFSLFPLKLLMLSMAFGVLLGAVQLIPSYEFSQLSNRSGPLTYEWVTYAGQLAPANLATLILPNYLGGVHGPYVGKGDIAHSSIYCGIIFLAVLPYALIKPRRETYFFGLMALMAVLISMGAYGFIFKIIYHVLPGFDLFRSPVHFRFIFAFFAALLTGIGLERILKGEFLTKGIQYGYLFIIYSLILILILIALNTPQMNKALPNIIKDFLLFSVLFFILNLILFLWKNRKLSINIFYISVLLLAFLDFYIHGSSASTIGARMRHNDWEKESSIVASLEERMKSFHGGKIETPFLSPEEVKNGLFRVYVEDGFTQHVQFLPYFPYSYLKLTALGFNRPILNRIFMVDGYSPMLLKRYVLFNSIFRDKDYKKFLMLSNVKYIVKSDDTIDVLPDLEILPRSFLVKSAIYVKNPDSIIDKLSDTSLDIRDEAIVEEPLELNKEGVCKGKKEARVVEYYPNTIKLTTESECPSLLVIGDTYYPGWKVKVDSGIRTDALKVNYCFMGTLIPPGKHIVFFEFNPRSFKIGLTISVLSLVSGVIIFLAKARKHKHTA